LRDNLPQPVQPHIAAKTTQTAIWQIHETGHGHLATLEQLVRRLTQRPLHAGNEISPLSGGDEAYPAMLAAIDDAQHSVTLATYIFDNDAAGTLFVDALGRAQERGVEVRVLVDAVGARYSWPTIVSVLRKRKIPVAKFLPSISPTMIRFFNLRNHRKILVVDGHVGFTGGMNIRACCMASLGKAHDTDDLHFRMEGPAVADLQHTFAIDWAFASGELLDGPLWFPELEEVGETLARGIADGPDEDMDHLRLTFMGALSCARRSVRIVTPYFLPETPLIDALNVCAMRGVEVDVVLPSKNNLFFVHWAMLATVAPMLERGVRIWLMPPPFDHTKLMVVDDAWCCFGSTNWDPRSLRLNFEFNVECYDRDLAAQLGRIVRQRIAGASLLTVEDLDGRGFLKKLRDGLMRLFLPYL
jgi:cardiolipin synthase